MFHLKAVEGVNKKMMENCHLLITAVVPTGAVIKNNKENSVEKPNGSACTELGNILYLTPVESKDPLASNFLTKWLH